MDGLLLIQFEGSFQPSWKNELQSLGVDLLVYVPDDAFVARAQGSRTGALRDLTFVRWVERYRPEFRVEARLQQRLQQGIANQPEQVAILLSTLATPAEVAGLRGVLQDSGQESRSRSGTILRGRLSSQHLDRVLNSPAVLWVESAPEMRLHDESASKIVGGIGTNHATLTQNWGYDGRGVTVAVADSGLDNGQLTNHTDLLGLTKALFAYGGLPSAADEHTHGTHVTGIIAGRGLTQEGNDEFGYFGLGVAPGASIVVQRIFDGRGIYRAPPSQETLTRDAVRAGAQIGNNSWGQDAQGRYNLSAFEYDGLVRDADAETSGDQPFVLCFSAGNAGPGLQSMTSPATAKNVIATGASQSARTNFFTYNAGTAAMADFSSRGPCEDGRIKPDLVAPGTWIASLLSSMGHETNAWGPINNEYCFMGGTSQASPHVAGGAAVFFQFYREKNNGSNPSPALVKAALIHSATPLDPERHAPDHNEGWGRVYLPALLAPDQRHDFLDQSVLLATGQVYERALVITDTNKPLRVTLAYTDFPGFPAAIPALVNDLDLELTGPDGQTYCGNQFEDGVSAANPPGHDSINNVEGIHLRDPLPGEYILRVRARNVVQDSVAATGTTFDQDFALVISGGFPPPGSAVVLLDQPTYTAPDVMAIKVVDPGRAGLSASVRVHSQSEPLGEILNLSAASASGVYTGAIATAVTATLNDGRLGIAHTNWIRVEYLDTSGQTRVAHAVADLLPPEISDVASTNQFGQFVIVWSTDELSSSVVRYGTTSSLEFAVTNNLQGLSHAVEIPHLIAGLVYEYVVISTDAAGNTATNDNNGARYSFLATHPPTVLLVDAYTPGVGEQVIQLSTYTDAIQQLGISYEVWSPLERGGLPTLNSLRSFPVVLWRINDSPVSSDTIPADQQLAIQQYLEDGGSFMICSMQILSRLVNQGSTAFLTNVLHVGKFLLNPNFSYCENCDEDFRVPAISGAPNDPIGQGLTMSMDYSSYRDDQVRGPDLGDTFTPATNAIAFLFESVSGKPCGMRYPRTGQDSLGRVVFASVPLDAFPEFGPSPNNRAEFLSRALQFLSPGLGGKGSIALHQDAYRIPDLIHIELADSDLAGQGETAVEVYSASDSTRVEIAMLETRRPGLFRGSVATSWSTNPPAPATIRVVHNDIVYAEYLDASSGIPETAMALIDITPPEMDELAVRAGFFDATISWVTSKPTDALVQFGESPFLGRTVYRGELSTNHSIRLIGLVPDRLYYFKVAVRDLAGNIFIDDNNGSLHQFPTVEPRVPPFTDSMENGKTNWTVLSSELSQRHWELGTPTDGHTVGACCGSANAWASNINGEPAEIIDTYLISPAIDLTGGNIARLEFYHDYNFEPRTLDDVISQGELLIVTNVLNEPLLLAVYTGSTNDYYPVEMDLTPYTGRVIFLIWRHHLLSTFPEEPVDRSGWAIDNVSVTLSNAPTGAIRVTNNLSQATFELRRNSLSRSGYGFSTTFSNLPAGKYEVTFNNVPYYQPPPRQTNTLAANTLLTFGGVYSFGDMNTNGMSDSWELVHFGEVSTNRTRTTDTDADGFTDFAEFVAGTDPRQSNSVLRVQLPTRLVGDLIRIQWPSVPGRSYRLQASFADGAWSSITDWSRASEYTSSVILTPLPDDPYIYRIQVKP